MKHLLLILSLSLALFSCHTEPEKAIENSPVSKPTTDPIKLRKFKKLFAVGDFDGDGKQDTLFEHHFSGLTKLEIDSSADPFQHEWDSVINWFYRQKANTYLAMNNPNTDTLHLGTSQGIYCLLNVGDNNGDGKEEIALVIDYLDFSRVNSCKIYTLCDHKWTKLKEFGIHEDSFDFTTDTAPVYTDIKRNLERQNGKWVYSDNLQDGYDNLEDVGKMTLLKTDKCN